MIKMKKKIRKLITSHPKLNPYRILKTNLFRVITSPFRILPDFLIIGAAKSGTTTLYDLLSQHPNVFPAKEKELNYFVRRWTPIYKANFPTIFQKFYFQKLKKEKFLGSMVED